MRPFCVPATVLNARGTSVRSTLIVRQRARRGPRPRLHSSKAGEAGTREVFPPHLGGASTAPRLAVPGEGRGVGGDSPAICVDLSDKGRAFVYLRHDLTV